MRRGVIVLMLAVGSVLAVASIAASAGASTSRTAVSPSKGGRTAKFVVSFTAPDAARTQGTMSRLYTISASDQSSGRTCGSNVSSQVTNAAANSRVHVTLSPKATGSRTWCKGTFKGQVTEISRPLCEPVKGPMHTARACPMFIVVNKHVGNFTFHVH